MDHDLAPDHRLRLAYAVFSVRRPERWDGFLADMLGLPAPLANSDGSRGWRLDGEAAQRLVVSEGRADDLAAFGLECADDRRFDALVARLRAAGVPVVPSDAALREARRVRRLVRIADPAGNAVELVVGLQPTAAPFASDVVKSGYRTGALGFGHLALIAPDLEAMQRFYVEQLGFGVSERLETKIGPIDVRGSFLHCNRRHHSIALFDLPMRKRLHHFMLQVQDMADVGAAFERAERLKVPLSLELGQHPDPDGTFSFYGSTPSGFDFEIGAGSKEIEPRGWVERRSAMTSSWGHAPRLRLQLRMAAELIASRWA